MRFVRRHRVLIVLLGLGILISILVGYRIKKQQAAAVMFEEQFPRAFEMAGDEPRPRASERPAR